MFGYKNLSLVNNAETKDTIKNLILNDKYKNYMNSNKNNDCYFEFNELNNIYDLLNNGHNYELAFINSTDVDVKTYETIVDKFKQYEKEYKNNFSYDSDLLEEFKAEISSKFLYEDDYLYYMCLYDKDINQLFLFYLNKSTNDYLAYSFAQNILSNKNLIEFINSNNENSIIEINKYDYNLGKKHNDYYRNNSDLYYNKLLFLSIFEINDKTIQIKPGIISTPFYNLCKDFLQFYCINCIQFFNNFNVSLLLDNFKIEDYDVKNQLIHVDNKMHSFNNKGFLKQLTLADIKTNYSFVSNSYNVNTKDLKLEKIENLNNNKKVINLLSKCDTFYSATLDKCYAGIFEDLINKKHIFNIFKKDNIYSIYAKPKKLNDIIDFFKKNVQNDFNIFSVKILDDLLYIQIQDNTQLKLNIPFYAVYLYKKQKQEFNFSSITKEQLIYISDNTNYEKIKVDDMRLYSGSQVPAFYKYYFDNIKQYTLGSIDENEKEITKAFIKSNIFKEDLLNK